MFHAEQLSEEESLIVQYKTLLSVKLLGNIIKNPKNVCCHLQCQMPDTVVRFCFFFLRVF